MQEKWLEKYLDGLERRFDHKFDVIEKLSEDRFDSIEKKVDALLAFKLKLLGGLAVVCAVMTFVSQLFIELIK